MLCFQSFDLCACFSGLGLSYLPSLTLKFGLQFRCGQSCNGIFFCRSSCYNSGVRVFCRYPCRLLLCSRHARVHDFSGSGTRLFSGFCV